MPSRGGQVKGGGKEDDARDCVYLPYFVLSIPYVAK